jgi:phosphatidylglycerol:prolipoprotein diacylglycerol transferase
LGRAERRRAEREQRRRNRPAAAVAPRPAGPEQEAVRSVLTGLERQKPQPLPVDGVGAGARKPPARVSRAPVPAPPRQASAEPAPAAVTTAASLRATTVNCGRSIAGAEPQALGLTYSFEAAEEDEPYTLRIGFAGRRTGVAGKPGPQDSFTAVETIEVVPGSGQVSITKRVENIAAGEWTVTAGPVTNGVPADPAAWPLPARASASGSTGFAPVIRVSAPGVRIGAWPGLVGLGAAIALAVQALLSARLALPVTPVLLLSLIASLIGLLGAKLYYLAEHPRGPRGWMNMGIGMCIQGFVIAAIGAVVLGALVAGLPVGSLLDVTAPGLLFGMAVGRVGCFLGGCCAGRPTASRWGLWCSDRRLGTRRIPTQLFESALALLLGFAALLVVWTAPPDPAGVVFVAAIAAYTLGRQLLFPLRDLPRHTAHGRVLVMTLAGLVLGTVLAMPALG